MKNTKGGKKHKKQGNVSQDFKSLTYAEEDQKYGKVTKILGHSRFEVSVYTKEENDDFTSSTLTGVARIGLKKKRMFISNGCYIIVSLRDFQKNICDIVHVYKDNQASMLVKKQLIPSTDFEHNEDEFKFEESYDEDYQDNKPTNNKNEPYLTLNIDYSEEEEEDNKEVEYDSYGNILS